MISEESQLTWTKYQSFRRTHRQHCFRSRWASRGGSFENTKGSVLCDGGQWSEKNVSMANRNRKSLGYVPRTQIDVEIDASNKFPRSTHLEALTNLYHPHTLEMKIVLQNSFNLLLADEARVYEALDAIFNRTSAFHIVVQSCKRFTRSCIST